MEKQKEINDSLDGLSLEDVKSLCRKMGTALMNQEDCIFQLQVDNDVLAAENAELTDQIRDQEDK